MHQHTGQHILSAVFVGIIGANTIGFHIGTDDSTLDLDATAISKKGLNQVEAEANQVVWRNLSTSSILSEIIV